MYAVLFDIDGTLLQSGGAGHVAFSETFAEVFRVIEIPTKVAFAGRSDRAIVSEIMRLCDIDPSPENWQRFYDDYCQRIDNVLSKCVGQLLPGVEALLDTLRQDAHVAIGLLTGNTHFGARAKTTAYGLGDRFAFGGYGDVRTNRDEIAADALLAAERWASQATPGDTLCGTMVIGDTPADVQCGRAIDAFVVAVATGNSSMDELARCQPDLVLEDLTGAERILAEISAAQQRCLQLATGR